MKEVHKINSLDLLILFNLFKHTMAQLNITYP